MKDTVKLLRSLVPAALLFCLAAAVVFAQSKKPPATELWRQVEVIRTEHGVPHIRATNLRAAGYALAWLQCEDYGTVTPMNLLDASGRAATVLGYERIETDLTVLRYRGKIRENFSRLAPQTRDMYEGFAAGVNRYIELHRDQFSAHMPSDFTGYDVAALEMVTPSVRKVRNFIARVNPQSAAPDQPTPPPTNEGPDDGSNAWAFAPSRTKSGKAILLRNPHLQWTAGYYEAHMTVSGVMDFYGDFRIGGPFAVIGGFNRDLGWATTNNAQEPDQIYALDVDPNVPDHFLFDGGSQPLKRDLVTAAFRNGEGLSTETREFWTTSIGPVIHRANGKIYVIKIAGADEFRAGEQFLRMMRAHSLGEWKEAMKLRARLTSNFTYADRAGNIFFIWNAALPLLPHQVGDDLAAFPAHRSADVWKSYVPFESLPQVLNPPGGYIHNENNSPHYTNVRGPVDTNNAYSNFEPPHLSLRSQLAIQLVGGDEKFSLEDVVRLKHSTRMLTADRVKNDLITAIKAADPTGDTALAVKMLEKWDNTAAPESRGSVLFEVWWQNYSGLRPPERTTLLPDAKRYARVWSTADPLNTPMGLADKARAVESFAWAVGETKRRYGSYDVAWGDVHRVRRGKVDVPVGGCSNDLGCFRVLSFARDTDGKLVANGGDGWVLAIEFGDTPRAFSVLAYGESRLSSSPYFDDQAAMFARGELKKVAFAAADVNAGAVVRFRPGEK